MNSEELLRQYLDTGLPIPTYQYQRLKGNLKKTYLRKRFIAVKNGDNTAQYHEFQDFSDEQKEYLKKFPRYFFLYPLNEQDDIINNCIDKIDENFTMTDISTILREIPEQKMDYVINRIFTNMGKKISGMVMKTIISSSKKSEEGVLKILYRWLKVNDNIIKPDEFMALPLSPQFTRLVHVKFLKKILSYPAENWNFYNLNHYLSNLSSNDVYYFLSEMITKADNVQPGSFLMGYSLIKVPYMQENILKQYISKLKYTFELRNLIISINMSSQWKKIEELNPINLVKIFLNSEKRRIFPYELSSFLKEIPENQHDEFNQLVKDYAIIYENINRIKQLL
jgi:hypothetical protein